MGTDYLLNLASFLLSRRVSDELEHEARLILLIIIRSQPSLLFQLGLLISSFLSVGGTRSVVQAASATRTLLKDVRRHSTEWIPFETSSELSPFDFRHDLGYLTIEL